VLTKTRVSVKMVTKGVRSMQLWEILVPTQKNPGHGHKNPYFTLKHHRIFDAYVHSLSGGITILSPAKGQWISLDGKLYAEKMIPCRIIADEDQMEQISNFVARHYNQLAVFFYLVSNDVRINHYSKGK